MFIRNLQVSVWTRLQQKTVIKHSFLDSDKSITWAIILTAFITEMLMKTTEMEKYKWSIAVSHALAMAWYHKTAIIKMAAEYGSDCHSGHRGINKHTLCYIGLVLCKKALLSRI